MLIRSRSRSDSKHLRQLRGLSHYDYGYEYYVTSSTGGRHRLVVRTTGFHPVNGSSILPGGILFIIIGCYILIFCANANFLFSYGRATI